MKAKRYCMTCKKEKLARRFADPFARSCNVCRAKRRCLVCGKPLSYGRKTCSDKCWHVVRTRAGQWKRPKRPPRKVRRCPGCKRLKPLTPANFARVTDGLSYTCKLCVAARARDRYHSDPLVRRQALARAALQRERQVAHRRKDPEFDELVKARYRAWYHQRRNGTLPVSVAAKAEGIELPAAPLAAKIDAEILRVRGTGEIIDGLASTEDVCAGLGVSARTVWRWRNQPGAVVRDSIADKVLIGLDLLWFDVWPPEDFPEVAERLAA